jgi:phage baseplate assembly protein W
MTHHKTNTPKLAVPFNFGVLFGGRRRAEVVEQDSVEEIQQCVEAVLMTTLGHRLDNPDFGVRDQTWRENGADLHEVQNAIDMNEPRANLILEQDPESLTKMVSDVSVKVAKRADIQRGTRNA